MDKHQINYLLNHIPKGNAQKAPGGVVLPLECLPLETLPRVHKLRDSGQVFSLRAPPWRHGHSFQQFFFTEFSLSFSPGDGGSGLTFRGQLAKPPHDQDWVQEDRAEMGQGIPG